MNASTKTKIPYSFALYALSRGKGVPEATRQAFNRAYDKLEQAKQTGNVIYLEKTRIGIEGETRLCAEFSHAQTGSAMLENIRSLIKDIELMNLKLEPCRKRLNRVNTRNG